MRRFSSIAATAIAVSLLAVAMPSSAQAATGYVLVGGNRFNKPQGCVETVTLRTKIENHTNKTIRVYDVWDCRGLHAYELDPGESRRMNDSSWSWYAPA